MQEIQNCTLDVTDGPLTDKNKLRSLIDYGNSSLPHSLVVAKYKKNGQVDSLSITSYVSSVS